MDKVTVDLARKEAEEAWTKVSLLKDAFYKAESDYIKKVSRFRNFDYELAQTDGRLKKVPSKEQQERKPKKQPELTLDQLNTIAAKLGISITIDEPEEETEDELLDEEVGDEKEV